MTVRLALLTTYSHQEFHVPAHLPGWVQSALFESSLIEIHLWVGYMTDPDHSQIQVEARDPISNTLLDLCAMPHVYSDRIRHLLVFGFSQTVGQLLTNAKLDPDVRQDLRELQLQIEALQAE